LFFIVNTVIISLSFLYGYIAEAFGQFARTRGQFAEVFRQFAETRGKLPE
jgi:hypothetical protein